MSLSKPKRSSFRIDDILSLKTSTNEDSEQDTAVDTSPGTNEVENIQEDKSRTFDKELQLLSERFQIQQTNSHSSLLQEIGNRKRRREEIVERALSEQLDLSKRGCYDEQSKDHDNGPKIFPLTPKATKLPTSLESLMRTHTHDYLLKLPGLNPWSMLANPASCLGAGILPPFLDLPPGGAGLGLGLAGARLNKFCLCGSAHCSSQRCDAQDGPHSFLRSTHSSSTNQDGPSIPIPLPVYVRTRDVTTLDNSSKPKKCRRSRTVFSELQLMGLEKKFETQKYLSTPDRLDVAERLGLTQLQVKTWYQNRRMKWKKQVLQGGGTEAPTKPKGRPRKDSLYGDSVSLDSPPPQGHESDSEDGELSDV